ncbi:hypothetical protein EDD15DRAFT_2441945 [Pisolithus albus]|nr:hypothetical protein EDD15DRAFT_2441945 [Pisolithus albus]
MVDKRQAFNGQAQGTNVTTLTASATTSSSTPTSSSTDSTAGQFCPSCIPGSLGTNNETVAGITGIPGTSGTSVGTAGSPASDGSGTSSNGTSAEAGTSTTSAAVATSPLQSTSVSTNAAGSTVLVTTTVTAVPSTSSSSIPTAAIVGGVVGGVVVLVVLVLLIYFIRRRSSKNQYSGDFEQDRIINHSGGGSALPQLDLSDEANNITPFNAYAADGDEEMREHGESPSLMGVAGTQAKHQVPNSSVSPSLVSYDSDGQFYLQGAEESGSGRQSLLAGPPKGAALPAWQYAQPKQLSMYDAVPADWYAPRLDSSLPPSSVPSTKEREAAGERDAYGLDLARQCEPLDHCDSPGPAEGRVVVHQDAGRAPEGVNLPQEIPPAYDSIQH